MCRGEHDRAVARLRAVLTTVPPDAPVRLGKPSSNLFRFGRRDRTDGLPGVGPGFRDHIGPGCENDRGRVV